MKKIFTAVFFMLTALYVFAQGLSGKDIMLKSDNRPKPKTASYKMEFILINSSGKQRVREVSSYFKDYGSEEKTVMAFLKPADVKGVGYLSFSYDEASKDDDRWLYMPALKKPRRITGSSSGDYFMGTDFTYDDIGGQKLDEYNHTLLGEENIGTNKCWKIESVSSGKSSYSKYISWIDQNSLLSLKAEFYDKQGGLLKIFTAEEFEKIDGYWISKKLKMENIQKKHTTIIEMKKMEYDKEISDSLFRVSSLENGKIR